jgi:hypothetical protein
VLPFPKRSALQADEVELDDDDLMVVEDAPVRPSLGGVGVRTVMTAREAPSSRLPAVRPPPVSSRSMLRAAPSSRPRSNPIDVRVEDEVIDECISSIEAAVAATSPGPMRASQRRYVDDQAITTRDPQLPSSAHRSARALPPPSTPAFVRRSQPMGWAPRAGVGAAQSHPSVAPVALSNASNEPTVIVVKQRPKSAFVLASAAIGALAAIVAMRLTGVDAQPTAAPAPAAAALTATALAPSPAAPAVASAASAAAAAAPTAAAEAPTAAAEAPAAAAEPTVVTFKDDQGVAIKVPASTSASAPSHAAAPVAKPHARPKAPSAGPPPLLPDTPAGRPAGVHAKVADVAPAPPAKTEAPARRRPLSAAERLAEEQLRAALK